MILADENISHLIITELRLQNIEVFSIYEHKRGITDAEIVEFSRNPARIILTEDKDFADIVFAYQTKNISVILLRYNFNQTNLITTILIDVLKNKTNQLKNKFTTITTQKIRIRDIEI